MVITNRNSTSFLLTKQNPGGVGEPRPSRPMRGVCADGGADPGEGAQSAAWITAWFLQCARGRALAEPVRTRRCEGLANSDCAVSMPRWQEMKQGRFKPNTLSIILVTFTSRLCFDESVDFKKNLYFDSERDSWIKGKHFPVMVRNYASDLLLSCSSSLYAVANNNVGSEAKLWAYQSNLITQPRTAVFFIQWILDIPWIILVYLCCWV